MVPLARRTVLGLCTTALAVSLAGCDERPKSGSLSNEDADDFVTDFEASDFRIDVDPDIALDPENPIIEYDDGDADRLRRVLYVIDDDDIGHLQFNHDFSEEDALRSLLRGIDYDERSVLIVVLDVSACYRWAVQYVERRSSDRLAPQFCSVKRDPSVECSLDDDHVQLTTIIVPDAYDRRPRGFGLGRSGNCILPPDHPEQDGGVQK